MSTERNPAEAVREALPYDWDAAHEALESMDDYARMDVGVAPHGPYTVLRDLLTKAKGWKEQADRLAALAGAAPNIGVGVDVSSDGVDVTVVLRDGAVDTVIHHEHHDLPHAPAKAREDWSVPVYFAGADSMGGTTYFATYKELHDCMTTGEASKRIRCYVDAGRIGVTPENLVSVLNGDTAGSVDYDALSFAEWD